MKSQYYWHHFAQVSSAPYWWLPGHREKFIAGVSTTKVRSQVGQEKMSGYLEDHPTNRSKLENGIYSIYIYVL
jgi:hypothetical protein